MAASQSAVKITKLPPKVLEHIFSFLPINERKNVSLVCRSWEDLAFPRSYLQGRVILQLVDYERTPLHQYGILCHSSRAYSRIFIYFGPTDCTAEQFRMVMNLMDTFGASIKSFSCANHFTASQLRLIVDKIPNVEELVVGLRTADSRYDLDFPVLNNLQELGSLGSLLESPAINIPAAMPNLRRLGAKFLRHDTSGRLLQVMQLLAPHLTCVELFATGYHLDISEVRFPQVEQMKLSGKIVDTDETVQRRFFEGFSSSLKFLIFKPVDFMLDIVTERCPLLQTVHMKTTNLGTAGRALRYLNRLRELKVLGLKGRLVESMLLSLYPMPSVETFHLYLPDTEDEISIFTRFAHLLPNVTEMRVILEERCKLMGEMFPLCTNFSQLRRLKISGRKLRFRLPNQDRPTVTLSVQDMGLLEELSLNDLDVRVEFRDRSENLKRLILNEVSNVTNVDMIAIAALYPNLRYLKVHNCREIRRHGIWVVKAQLPRIVVDYDNQRYRDARTEIPGRVTDLGLNYRKANRGLNHFGNYRNRT